jgi:hypothetical protein
MLDKEQARFHAFWAASDWQSLVNNYPVRETRALNDISKALGFTDCDQYESAVRKLIMDDPTAVEFVRTLFGGLYEALTV